MKKAMFLVVLAVLLVSLFGWAAPVLADDGENFRRAGQKVLAEKEQILLGKKVAIETFVTQIAEDRVVTGDEMIALNKAIDDFARAKVEADSYLKFYNLSTKTALEKELVDVVKQYYVHDSIFWHDRYGKTRGYFVGLTAHDVIVEKSGPIILWGQIILMILIIIASALTVLCVLAGIAGVGSSGDNVYCFFLAMLFCIISIVITIGLLF